MRFERNWLLKMALIPVLVELSACSRETRSDGDPLGPIPVETLVVKAEPVRREVELVGTLEGQREVTVSSEVEARVISIVADLGDRVAMGAPLIELDPTEFRLAVARQRAALRGVVARLGMAKDDDPPPDPEKTSMVRRATADLAEAKSAYERAKNLVADGVVSGQVYDSADARYRSALAGHTAALEEVRNLEAQIEGLRAQLGIAQRDLTHCTIRSPFAGTVRQRLVEIGQYAREQTPVMSLASTNPLKLRAEVPERWFPWVKTGAAVEVTIEAYPGEKFPGKLARVSGAVDPKSRTFAVEAEVANAEGRLRPGVFARAALTTDRADAIVRVPASAVVSFYGVQKVYVVEGEEVKELVVKLGDRYGDSIEVVEGLPDGSRVATTELARIRQGSRVQVKKES